MRFTLFVKRSHTLLLNSIDRKTCDNIQGYAVQFLSKLTGHSPYLHIKADQDGINSPGPKPHVIT